MKTLSGLLTVLAASSAVAAPAQSSSHAVARAAAAADPLLAFPGAEGFGRNAIGGRTGEVYKVTNLK